MGNVNDAIARMKELALYGQVNESEKRQSNYTLCEHAEAADGKVYGIVKECNRYYIKYTTPEKATLAEAYEYVSGFSNKKRDEFTSHNAAVNFFDQKINSINEAHDSNARVSSLDPFKRDIVIEEGHEEFANELARQRQIMYNAGMLLGESKDFVPVKEKGCTTAQPEAETGKKGDKMEGAKDVKPDMGYKGSKTSGVKVDGGMPEAKTVKEACEKCGCTDGSCHCCDTDFDEGMDKGKDPKQVGWNMEGQKNVNEEADEKFSEGLPSSEGVGDADTDHNNDPFNKGVKSVNEAEEDVVDDVDPVVDDADADADVEDDADFDADLNADDADAEEGADDIDDADEFDGEADDIDADDDIDLDEPVDDEASDVDESDPESIRAEIERLQGLLDDMEGDEEPELGDESDEFSADDISDDEPDVDDDTFELDDEEPEIDDDEVEIDDEDYLDNDDMDECGNGTCPMEGCNESYDYDDEDEDSALNRFVAKTNKMAEKRYGKNWDKVSKKQAAAFSKDNDESDEEEGEKSEKVEESKARFMNSIVESVVRQFVNEDELHVFGKHPGYRKKPFTTPQNGPDKNEHGRDWNDDSCHGEQPFGEKIGNGDPFTKLVDAVTADVKYQLKKGLPIEGAE